MGTATDTVLAMIEGWNNKDIDAILACFASDAIYHNMPMEPVHGTAAIRESLNGFLASASEVQWDVLHIAENASGVVLNERVDKFKIAGQWLEVPVMGTFEVNNGVITAWRDYFDLAGFEKQMAAISG